MRILAPDRRHGPNGQRVEKPCTVTFRMPRSPDSQRTRRHAVAPDCTRAQTVYSRGKRRRKRIVPVRGTNRSRDSRLTTQDSPHCGGESVMLTWSPGAIPFIGRGSYAWRKSIRYVSRSPGWTVPEPLTTIANPASDTAGTTASARKAPIAVTDRSSLLPCDLPPLVCARLTCQGSTRHRAGKSKTVRIGPDGCGLEDRDARFDSRVRRPRSQSRRLRPRSRAAEAPCPGRPYLRSPRLSCVARRPPAAAKPQR
jgi:hypothetical protein